MASVATILVVVALLLVGGHHRKPHLTGHWYPGCAALNPNIPDFPECRPL